jgi:4-amino-4-deoxy-L-arabinose transferase-like glycosyltransferase
VNKHIFLQSAVTSSGRVSSENVGTQSRFDRFIRTHRATIAVVALAIAAVLVWISGFHFAVGTQPDEVRKVDAVLTGPTIFYHPLLMIHLARAANALLGLTDPEAVAELGRGLAAIAGGTIILATYLLARVVLPASASFAVAAATLATPLITVHARYFKEDIFVAPFVLLAIAALIAALRTPTVMRAMTLGAAIGLASGSKYVAGFLLLPYMLTLMMIFGHRDRNDTRMMYAGIAALTAAIVFGLIEVPALLAMRQFRSDFRIEYFHALRGHSDIALPLALTQGIFHLRESLWPGLGPPLTVLGVLGFVAPFLAPRGRRQPLAVIAGFAFLWYLAHEISPLKPYPGFTRYMVPLAPLLLILGAASINEWVEQHRPGAGAIVATVAMLLASVPAWWISLRINVRAFDDPRRLLPDIVANARGNIAVDFYAGFEMGRPFLAQLDERPTVADTAIIVTSSLNYDRYKRYGTLPQQSPETLAETRFFARILALPHIDVSNGQPSFAFFNPTTTVIAMDGNPDRLLPIARAIEEAAPSLIVRWNTSISPANAAGE